MFSRPHESEMPVNDASNNNRDNFMWQIVSGRGGEANIHAGRGKKIQRQATTYVPFGGQMRLTNARLLFQNGSIGIQPQCPQHSLVVSWIKDICDRGLACRTPPCFLPVLD